MNRNVIFRIALPMLSLALTAALVAQTRRASSARDPGAEATAAASSAAGAIGAAGSAGATSAAGVAPTAGPGGADARALHAEGRVVTYPGGEVAVGTDIAGTLTNVAVQERDRVRRGQPLASILADDLRAEWQESRARLAESDAELKLAAIEIDRARKLVDAGVTPSQELDRRLRDRDAAQARHDTAVASIARLNALLEKTRIVAPIDGAVVERQADAGETLERGDPILTIADLAHLRIEAEVDEFDADRVALGAPVEVTAEGYEGRTWRGHVEEIPEAVTHRALKPQDPGRPTDTRVLLVKVALDLPTPLKLGQRVQVAISLSPQP